jgi:chromosome segregation ATPase
MNPLSQIEPFFAFFDTDEGGQGGGAATGEKTAETTAPETVTRDEHQRELDRYRNQYGQEKKAREALEKRLQELEDAQKTETQRLAEKAARADELTPALEATKAELDTLRAALEAEAEAQAKLLPRHEQKLYAALPECSAAQRLEWIRTARAEAAEREKAGGLPPSGTRNPAHQKPNTELTDEERQRASRTYANSF